MPSRAAHDAAYRRYQTGLTNFNRAELNAAIAAYDTAMDPIMAEAIAAYDAATA